MLFRSRLFGMDGNHATNTSATEIEAKLENPSLTEQQKHDFSASEHVCRLFGMDGKYATSTFAAEIEAKLVDTSLTEQQKRDLAASEHVCLMEKINTLGTEPTGQYRSTAPSPESFTGSVEEGLTFETFNVEAGFEGSSTAAEILKRLDTIEAALEQTQLEDGLAPSPMHAECPKVEIGRAHV